MHVICLKQGPMDSKHTHVSAGKSLNSSRKSGDWAKYQASRPVRRGCVLNELTVQSRKQMHTGNFSTTCSVLRVTSTWVASDGKGTLGKLTQKRAYQNQIFLIINF